MASGDMKSAVQTPKKSPVTRHAHRITWPLISSHTWSQEQKTRPGLSERVCCLPLIGDLINLASWHKQCCC